MMIISFQVKQEEEEEEGESSHSCVNSPES